MSEGEREAPRRLRAADVIENLERTIEQLTTRPSRVPDVGVEFTRNAKGETQINVKVSAPSGTPDDELRALGNQVSAAAHELYEAATRRYPSSSGKVTNDSEPAPFE